MDRRVLGVTVVLTGVAALASAASRPSAEPAAAQCRRSETIAAASCVECHAEIGAQWRSSGHATAFDDPVFAAEYEPAPSAFCDGCHAPALAGVHDGVDCASCHGASAAASGPSGAEACATCHQFAFEPDHPVYDPADPMQDTVHEWQQSGTKRTCVDCHMPRRDGVRSHRFVGAGDPSLVASALDITATREGSSIRIVLDADAAGHAVPTGDMYRRLRVAAWSDDHDDAAHEQWLMRVFAQVTASTGEGFARRPVVDTRPRPGQPRTVVLPARPDAPVHWSVELHRLDPSTATARGLTRDQVVTPVASGVLE